MSCELIRVNFAAKSVSHRQTLDARKAFNSRTDEGCRYLKELAEVSAHDAYENAANAMKGILLVNDPEASHFSLVYDQDHQSIEQVQDSLRAAWEKLEQMKNAVS